MKELTISSLISFSQPGMCEKADQTDYILQCNVSFAEHFVKIFIMLAIQTFIFYSGTWFMEKFIAVSIFITLHNSAHVICMPLVPCMLLLMYELKLLIDFIYIVELGPRAGNVCECCCVAWRTLFISIQHCLRCAFQLSSYEIWKPM